MANFLEIHKNRMENGFWTEFYPSDVKYAIESMHTNEVIREWYVAEITNSEKNILVKWAKRYHPLSDDQLKEKYGR